MRRNKLCRMDLKYGHGYFKCIERIFVEYDSKTL